MKELNRLPPKAVEMEEAVLGAIMIDRDAIPKVLGILDKDHFYDERHLKIYEIVQRLYNRGKDIDILTVTEEARINGGLESVGGPYYITSLTSRVASAAHVEHHAYYVLQKFMMRELIRISSRDVDLAYSNEKDPLELVSDHLIDINNIINYSELQQEKRAGDILEKVLKNKGGNGIDAPNFLEGVSRFNNGDFIILAARPSMGKTALAVQLAKEISYDGYPVGFLSLEMSGESLVMRLVSSETGIPYERIAENNIYQDEEERFHASWKEIDNLSLFIDDSSAISPMQAKAKASRMVTQRNIKILFVDYLQLMRVKAQSREQEVSLVSSMLKQIAKDLKIPVIALSQLNRSNESRSDKKPMLSDLRDSGSLEQDADMVMFLHRPEYYGIMSTDKHENTEGLAELIIAKNRNGKLGTFDLKFNGQRFNFEKWEKKLTPLNNYFP